MCREPVEDVGCHCITADDSCEHDDHRDRHGVEKHDEEAIHCSLESSLGHIFRTLHEEGYRHRYHREYARCKKHCESPEDGLEDEPPDGAALLLCRLFYGNISAERSDSELRIY